MSSAVRVLQLYPRDMNIYGDWGNTQVLTQRLRWHGYQVELLSYDPGDTFPSDVDLIVGGGGQDSGQDRIKDDLISIGSRLRELAEAHVPMLVICGLYQLFGHRFITGSGQEIPGIGIFDAETRASSSTTRLIGNIVLDSDQFGMIVGYENHSGLTTLGSGCTALGTVRSGGGNNGTDGTEGARVHNVIGSYLHGSLLPKNPAIADWLIAQAVEHRLGEGSFTPGVIDDRWAEQARTIAMHRPR